MSASSSAAAKTLLLAVQGAGRTSPKNQDALDPSARAQEGLSRRIRLLKTDELHPDPEQPRRSFDEEAIARLAETVRAYGILSPIVVSPREGEGGFTIVLGERRWRAARQAGLAEVPTITTGALALRERLELQLLENLGREDLNVVEEGRGYQRLVRLGASQRDIALKVGRSEASVSRALAIAQKLEPEWLDEATRRKELQSPSKLYEIACAPEAERAALFERLRSGASREALQGGGRAKPLPARSGLDPALERELSTLLEKLRARFRKRVDLRRLNRRAVVELALRRLLEGWNEESARALLRSLGGDL